jgi:multidrug efflux pump subunit AcrA (membrane-fusion protein)
MSNAIRSPANRRFARVAWLIVGIAAVGFWATNGFPLPTALSGKTAAIDDHAAETANSHGKDHHDEHAGHIEDNSIELSPSALKNIGYKPIKVALGAYDRTMTLPAMVVEKAGRTQIHLTSPVTGVVMQIRAVAGEAVERGSPMFEVRLTHEELVNAQRDYLKTAENLEVVNRELARLQLPELEGVIARKLILEKQYEKQKLDASLQTEKQSLLLHGLSEAQVDAILSTRQMLKSLTITAPDHVHTGDGCEGDHLFHVQRLPVSQGQQVEAGQELSVLADHCELFLEGRAFEDDANVLRNAVAEGWPVSATLLIGEDEKEKIDGLKVLYLADTIESETRAFHFYLRLPNSVVLDQKDQLGHRFVEWRYKPGQRMELRIPVKRWTDRIVLPVDAIVEEGAEIYVYRQNGDHFDRVPVHIEYRDRETVVIANDGAIFPDDVVAGAGAYQMHLALKNKAGGGVDPHAGHNH